MPGVGWGSSPRVRGKQKQWTPYRPSLWLIPACAGKTRPNHSSSPSSRAHPRVCGENNTDFEYCGGTPGSSPRVRGKQRGCWKRCNSAGLIPACAGKTRAHQVIQDRCQAHPRVCGENTIAKKHRSFNDGSSPRVRGKQSVIISRFVSVGLIPACAGKTHGPNRVCHANRAHPRVCGENTSLKTLSVARDGSSPRVRGKPSVDAEPIRRSGLIPACAGKTLNDLEF